VSDANLAEISARGDAAGALAGPPRAPVMRFAELMRELTKTGPTGDYLDSSVARPDLSEIEAAR
jgi:hypothetical protein